MAHASFQITSFRWLGPVDSLGKRRAAGTFIAYFTSGRVAPVCELTGSLTVESPPGTPKTVDAIKLLVFQAVRAECNRLDAIDAMVLDADVAGPQTRWDATLASPTEIDPADVPPVDGSPPRL